MTVDFKQEKEIAIAAVRQAAELCQAVRRELVVDSLQKDDRSPVTVADFGSQALVCRQINAQWPADPIVAEEDSAALRQPENAASLAQVLAYVARQQPQATAEAVCAWIDAGNGQPADRFWTLDPIDGTKGFLRNDQYAIALALIEGGQVQVAALACPAMPHNLDDPQGPRGLLFTAVRGQGAQQTALDSDNFSPIRVAAADDPARLRFVESVEARHGNQPLQKAIAQAAGISAPSVRMDSQAKYGAVAQGEAALYLRLPSPKSPDYREKIWDHAAGALIVEEAGGTVTDMHGRALDFASDSKMRHNQGIIVSNGIIHQTVLTAIANVKSR